MYLKQIQLTNIKCFENVKINFTAHRGKPRLMTVILGDNGVGKSTLLQAIAVALGSDRILDVLRSQKPRESWTRHGHKQGYVHAAVRPGSRDELPGSNNRKRDYEVRYIATGEQPITEGKDFFDRFSISHLSAHDYHILTQTLYSDSSAGWFGAGYGPFRRVQSQSLKVNQETGFLRFLSLFGYDAYLMPVEQWLTELDRRALVEERKGTGGSNRLRFNQFAQTLRTLFPPADEKIMAINGQSGATNNSGVGQFVRVTADQGVLWSDTFGNWIPLSELSDGYLSTITWAGDLVSLLAQTFPDSENPHQVEGVVLIDEVDIHLHPSWQRTILEQIRVTFPSLQFIVTTHSPLVAAGAREGELVLLKREGDHVVAELENSVQGWRADQILTSSLMIKVQRAPKPPSLNRSATQWTQELLQAIGQHQRPGGRKPPKRLWDRYNKADVRKTLRNMFHNKCAYCESKIPHVAYPQIEHFRPKVSYPHLTFDWDNLVLACGSATALPTRATPFHLKTATKTNPYY